MPEAIAALPDDVDLEMALEREELADLLDRALALLPPAAREVIVARHVAGSPHAAIAARLGIGEKAVAMRLARGKLLLRRALATELRDEAAAYGLAPAAGEVDWGETRIWCPNCGRRRLVGRFDRARHALDLRCPDCHPRLGVAVCSATWPAALAGVRGYKAALSRVARSSTAQFRRALAHGAAPCSRCGHPARLIMGMPADLPPAVGGLPPPHLACDRCGFVCNQALRGLALALPEARAFWRAHPRIRIPPERPLAETDGRPAILTRIESATGAAGLDILAAAADFRVLAIRGAP